MKYLLISDVETYHNISDSNLKLITSGEMLYDNFSKMIINSCRKKIIILSNYDPSEYILDLNLSILTRMVVFRNWDMKSW